MKINFVDEQNPKALVKMYPRQHSAQPVFVWVNEEGAGIDYDPEIGGAVPADVWAGLTRRIALPIVPTAQAANVILTSFSELIERVGSGIIKRYDGSRYIGKMTDDAMVAYEILEGKLSEHSRYRRVDQIDIISATDWFAGAIPVITADTTDTELDMIEEKEQSSVPDDIYVYGIGSYLNTLRDDARKGDGDYITVTQAAEKWGINGQRVRVLLKDGRIPGAIKIGRDWVIPSGAEKPSDARKTPSKK